MKYFVFIMPILFFGSTAIAQHEYDFWYFGYNEGLDFRKIPPILLDNGPTFTQEGCAVMGDSETGEPRIICDGINVFDRNGNIMPNGGNLISDYSSSQAAIIIPWACHENKFFIISTDQQGYAGPSRGSHYSIVDMTLNNGLGEVTTKNILLNPSTDEHLTAVHYPFGNYYWVLLHSNRGNTFYAYRISSDGIATAPVMSVCGTPEDKGWSLGYLKASPNGRKLAIAGDDIQLAELFDFDPFTGKVSNPLRLINGVIDPNYETGPYGICFSPDNTKLYFATNARAKLYQCDVSLGTGADILKSITLMNDTLITYSGKFFAAMALGPDKIIYVHSSNWTLGVINNPNVKGKECDFRDTVIEFKHTRQDNVFGLPNIIEGRGSPIPNILFNTKIVQDTITSEGVVMTVIVSPTIQLPDIEIHGHFDTSDIEMITPSCSNGMFNLDASGSMISSGIEFQLLFKTQTSSHSSIVLTIDSVLVAGNLLSCQSSSQNIILNLPCGDQTLSAFMRTERIPSFIINPNPAENYLTIKSSKSLSNTHYIMFDQLGRSILHFDALNISQVNKVTLDVSGLSSGMYFLRLEANGFSRSQSVIINH